MIEERDSGYNYIVLENGKLYTEKITDLFKDNKKISSRNIKVLIDDKFPDKRGLDLLTTLATPEFIALTKAEDNMTGSGFEENVKYQTEILKDGQVGVRKAIRTYKDGVEIAKTYHRHVVSPGDDLTNQDEKVKKVANVLWTEEVIQNYLNSKKT